MKLEIILPVVLALLSLSTMIAFKFNESYQKYKVYLVIPLYMILIAFFFYSLGINKMYISVIPNYADSKLLSSIYDDVQVDVFTFLVIWLPTVLYIESIGHIYRILKSNK